MQSDHPADAVESSELEQPKTRKLVLAGGLGALGTLAAGRWLTDDAQAANGKAIIQGRKSTGTKQTTIQSNGKSGSALRVNGRSTAILAQATNNAGTGVKGESPAGLGVRGTSSKGTGIRGQSSEGRGVWGSSQSGVGVQAQSTSGPAFRAIGNVEFASSGIALVPSNAKTIGVFPSTPVNEGSYVLATLASNPGNDAVVHFCTIDPAAGSFALHLSKQPAQAVQVAWFVINPVV